MIYKYKGFKKSKESSLTSTHSKPKKLYLYLNVPLSWVERCSVQKGSCLALAIHLLWVHFVTKKNPVKIQSERLRALGVSRYSAYRALKKLQEAELVDVKSKKGAFATVTLLLKDNEEKYDIF